MVRVRVGGDLVELGHGNAVADADGEEGDSSVAGVGGLGGCVADVVGAAVGDDDADVGRCQT